MKKFIYGALLIGCALFQYHATTMRKDLLCLSKWLIRMLPAVIWKVRSRWLCFA